KTVTWMIDLPIRSFPIGFQNEGDASISRQWLEGMQASRPFQLSPAVVPQPRSRVALRYLGLGFAQVLPQGTDLILVLLGILLLSLRPKPMIVQAAAFALAQSLALALSA